MSDDIDRTPANREKLHDTDNLQGICFGSGKWDYPDSVKNTAEYPAEYVRKNFGNARFMG